MGGFCHECPLHGTLPKANASFSRAKITTNQAPGVEANSLLHNKGWKGSMIGNAVPPALAKAVVDAALERNLL